MILGNDTINQKVYHVIGATGAYEDYHTWVIYILPDKETSIDRVKELFEKDRRCAQEMNNMLKEYIKKLCDKYKVAYTDNENDYCDVYDELSVVVTEEEDDTYTQLYYDANTDRYENDYYVEEYELNPDGSIKKWESVFAIYWSDDDE